MQVTETLAEGLKRQYDVALPASAVEDRLTSRLREIGRTLKMPGFRPGKVPLPILKQRYAGSVMGEVVEALVQETSSKVLAERALRSALQPKVEITRLSDEEGLAFTMALEVLPEVEPGDLSGIALERESAPVTDAAVDEAMETLRRNGRSFKPVETPRAAASGDVVVIDFVGRMDGTPFEGGTGNDFPLELGSGQFIPGFEEQLIGIEPGDTREVAVRFPDHYHANHDLQGREASFTVTAKEIRERVEAVLDEEFAKARGFDTEAALREAVRQQLERDHQRAARLKVKRRLLDRLAEMHDFAVPAGMVDSEFDSIWGQVEHARQHGELEPEQQGKSEEELRAEYRSIAERRVRLGLLLSEVGRRNNIIVAEDELRRAVLETARRYPGQEREVLEFYRRSPESLASLRAPILEEKVVDFILGIAKIEERAVSREELLADAEAA